MSSSGRPPRSRYRFGFRGKRPARNTPGATTDDILDSLTRQAKSMKELGDERTLELQTILEDEPTLELSRPEANEPIPSFARLKSRNFSRAAFAAMLIVGIAFLWVYSRLSQTLNVQGLAALQQAVSKAGFADWQKAALIALSALTIGLLARRSRNKIRSAAISTIYPE